MGKKKIFSSQKGKVFTDSTVKSGQGILGLGLLFLCGYPCYLVSGSSSSTSQQRTVPKTTHVSDVTFSNAIEEFDKQHKKIKAVCKKLNKMKLLMSCVTQLHVTAIALSDLSKKSTKPDRYQIRNEKQKTLIETQTRVFPKVRDKLGPDLRHLIHKGHGKLRLKTTGEGYTTLKFATKIVDSEDKCRLLYAPFAELVRQVRFTTIECATSLSKPAQFSIKLNNIKDTALLIWNPDTKRYEAMK